MGDRKFRSMNKVLTIGEMESQFKSEWILVGDPETDESLKVKSGAVLHHSKDRDEVYRKAVELKPRRFAMLYTGTLPKDTAIIL
jgi:hypothetical protein